MLTEPVGGLGGSKGGDGVTEDRSDEAGGKQGVATENSHRDRGEVGTRARKVCD